MAAIRRWIGNAALFALLPTFYLVWPVGTILMVKPFWLVLVALPFAALGVLL